MQLRRRAGHSIVALYPAPGGGQGSEPGSCLAPLFLSRPGFAPVYTARSFSLRIRAHASSVCLSWASRRRSGTRLPCPSGHVKLALRGAGVTSGSACGSCDQWLFGLTAVVLVVRSFGPRVAGPRSSYSPRRLPAEGVVLMLCLVSPLLFHFPP